MELNYKDFEASYASWGLLKSQSFTNLEQDNELFNSLSIYNDFGEIHNNLPEDPFCMTLFSDSYKINDNDVDLVPIGFKSLDWFSNSSLPEDPFGMRVRSTLNSFSDWFDENQQKGFSCVVDDAFELVLAYLELRDVLAVEGVCRSLRDTVRKDPFFWRSIDLGCSEVKYRVTDESLLKLTGRARGNVQCLNLGGCVKVTDRGLSLVLASNPRLTKLSVSGCLLLSTERLLSTLRELKSLNRLGVKTLITGGALYLTKEQFKELNLLLGGDVKAVSKSRKRRYYTFNRSGFTLEDGRVTDLEICPRCEKPGMVFDCVETCPLKDHPCPKSSCRACVVCIERCHVCGSCLNDCEHKSFSFEKSCVVCYKKSDQLQEFI